MRNRNIGVVLAFIPGRQRPVDSSGELECRWLEIQMVEPLPCRSPASRQSFRIGVAIAILTVSTAALAGASGQSFHESMADAMSRMHAAMATAPSGDPDRDFAAMMIPHHEGAIEMARLELLHGKDERLRRLAHGIIVEQGQEIELMRHVLASRPQDDRRGPGEPPHRHSAHSGGAR